MLTLLFLFFSGNTNSIFALDYISGALTLNGPLDRENPFYSAGFILTVKVRPAPAGKHMDRAGWKDEGVFAALPACRYPRLACNTPDTYSGT